MILDPLAGLVEHGRRQVVVARFIGKIAVDRAVAELRDRIAPAPRSAVPVIETIAMSTADDPPVPAPDPVVLPVDSVPVDTPPREDLVLPDYDHLPAAHVVSKLASLTPKERTAIEQYERAHRHRRTILGKIEQLRTA